MRATSMEVEDMHASKRSRMRNGGEARATANSGTAATAKVGQEQRQDEDEEDGEGRSLLARGGGGGATIAGVRGLRPWHQHSAASRIYRVSRASGGKDRHSKVMTAKGLRDRRVRLSVSTAIQFYDLQDRLGYDQPSKAIEWLIKAAAAAITDLPSLDGAFPNQPPPGKQLEDEEKSVGAANGDEEDAADVSQLQYTNHHHLQHQQEEQRTQQQQQRFSLTKSTCSSTSDTSKGSVLSLSRSEIRVKARERARERTATAKDKEKDREEIEDDAHVPTSVAHHQTMNPNPTSQSSFTELLTGGGHQNDTQDNHGPVTVAQVNPALNFIHKQFRQMPTSVTGAATTTDYFGQVGLLGTGQKLHQSTIFPTNSHFGNSSPMGMVPFNVAAATGDDHPEIQQHYMQEHVIPFSVTAAGGDYINFSISSGFNRGTLQSNSPSPLLHHHLQMFSSPVDGSNLPFFLGAAAQAASASGEGQLPTGGFDSRLQLCYRHSDLKGKGKN